MSERYRLLHLIGEGGVGQVWSSEQSATARRVGIKIYSGLERLSSPETREASMAALESGLRRQATLQSPFVLNVLDMALNASPPYAIFDLAQGGNLRQCLTSGPLEPKFALNVFSQVLHGLQSAHDIGLVHEDLKPENILFDESANVRISDFGLASVIELGEPLQFGRYVGFGSLGYMAPELMLRNAVHTPASDVYALGILLYEMLVGQIPGRRAPLPSDVIESLPSVLDELYMSMTHDDLDQRLVDLESVIQRLSEAEGLPIPVNQASAQVFTQPPIALPGLHSLPSADTPVSVESTSAVSVSVHSPQHSAPVALSASQPKSSTAEESKHQQPVRHDSASAESTRLLDRPNIVEPKGQSLLRVPEDVPTAVPIKVTQRPRSASAPARYAETHADPSQLSHQQNASLLGRTTDARAADFDDMDEHDIGSTHGLRESDEVTRPKGRAKAAPVSADESNQGLGGRRESINTVVTKIDMKP